MKKKIKEYLSKCCKAVVIGTMSPDFIGDKIETMTVGTCCFMCSKCGKPCDIIQRRKQRKQKNEIVELDDRIIGKSKKEKTCKLKDVYKLLHTRPFCKCANENKDIYDAYCLRIIETLED